MRLPWRRLEHALPPGPWRPAEGDRVFIRGHVTPHDVVLVEGDQAVCVNVDHPLSRVSLPVSWLRPVDIFPDARRRVTAGTGHARER